MRQDQTPEQPVTISELIEFIETSKEKCYFKLFAVYEALKVIRDNRVENDIDLQKWEEYEDTHVGRVGVGEDQDSFDDVESSETVQPADVHS